MYKTRIVKIGDDYFVDYKWVGGILKAFLYDEPIFWKRYSMVPCNNIEDAHKMRDNALKSYELNYHNVEIIE